MSKANLHVQFENDKQTTIIQFFGGEQPDIANYGVVAANDPRWKEFYDRFPTHMQSALPQPE